MAMKIILLAAGVAVAAALPAAPVSKFGARSAPTATGRNLSLRGGGPLSLEQAQMVTTGLNCVQGAGMILATDKVSDAYGVGNVSAFSKSIMQVMGFSLVGIGTYWHLVRTGAMSAEESLAAMVGISSLGRIFWAVMHAGALKQDPTGAGIQGVLGLAIAYCLYNDINAADVAKYYGLYCMLIAVVGYAYPKKMCEVHGIDMAQDPLAKELLKGDMTNIGLMAITLLNGSHATKSFGAGWMVQLANWYIGLANESSKVVGMPDDTPMKVWVLISLAMVMSAGGASF